MIEKVKAKLISIGCKEVTDSALNMLIHEVESYIKNYCNISSIPNELMPTAVQMVCGKYLLMMKSFGKLTDFDFGTAIQSISEGDTSVSFDVNSSAENLFLTLITNWANPDLSCLLRFRKLVW